MGPGGQEMEPDGWYFGNAVRDDVRGSGWFVGQFVPAQLGLRHQTAIEVKWGRHPKGERRPAGPEANQVATTVSVLVRGALLTRFDHRGQRHEVLIKDEGDYIIFGPDVVHAWEALEDTVVLSLRFPSVERRTGPFVAGNVPPGEDAT